MKNHDTIIATPHATILSRRCEASTFNVTSSYYHSALGVAVESYPIFFSWSKPITNFDNLGVTVWTLVQVSHVKCLKNRP